MADNLLYEQSLETQGGSEPFVSRQVVQVLDQNGGNYNGQIQIDTSSLSNSGKYASYGEAYLVIPLVTVLDLVSTDDTDAHLAAAQTAIGLENTPWVSGLKCGFHQLIHSLSVSYNNSDVVQLTPYTNFYVQYKLLTQLSEDDLRKIGPSIGFYPDSSSGWQYTEGAIGETAIGKGSKHNRNGVSGTGYKSTYATFFSSNHNEGFEKRQLDTAYTAEEPFTTLLTDDNARSIGKSIYGTNTDGYRYWYTLAKIRLKDLHSFFEQLPLVKGAFLSLRINTNTAVHNLETDFDTTGGITSNIYCTSSVINGGTSPLLLASADTPYNGTYSLINTFTGTEGLVDDNTWKWNYRLNIGKDTTYPLSHPTWGSQVRLFVPMYQMSPVDEEKYLSINRTKRIVYEDIYSYQTNVDAGRTFNQLLTNGIPNPTTVVCIPFLQNTANYIGAGATDNPTPPFQSPFSSEPGTTSPLTAFKDFNIQVAGINMFTQNENYDFEQFFHELQSKNAINGGLVNGLTSGLISELDFYNNYRYYVCDVSRRLPAEDTVPKSIAIMGQNLSAKPISIYTFIVFKREITIDLATGQKLE